MGLKARSLRQSISFLILMAILRHAVPLSVGRSRIVRA
jgi:hypothetical protein